MTLLIALLLLHQHNILNPFSFVFSTALWLTRNYLHYQSLAVINKNVQTLIRRLVIAEK